MGFSTQKQPQPVYAAGLRLSQVLLGLAIGIPIVDFTKAALGREPSITVGFEQAVVFGSLLIIGVYFFWSHVAVVAKFQFEVTFWQAVVDLTVIWISIGLLFVLGQTWMETNKFVFFYIILLSVDLAWELETLSLYGKTAKRLLWKRFGRCLLHPKSKEFTLDEKDTTATLWWLASDVAELALLVPLLRLGVSSAILALVVLAIQLLIPLQIWALRHQFWLEEK